MTLETRAQALAALDAEPYVVPEGLEFTVRALTPPPAGDAWAAARCFHAVHGDRYPFDTAYVPRLLLEANAAGHSRTVVAVTAAGQVVALGTLFRGSCPNPQVWEVGQLVVLPSYRGTLCAFEVQRQLMITETQALGIEMTFGEAVCHHVVTQKMTVLLGAVEAALELDALPAAVYEPGQPPSIRASLLMYATASPLHERTDSLSLRRPLFLPAPLAEALRTITGWQGLDRDLAPAYAALPQATPTRLEPIFLDAVGLARANVHSAGQDFAHTLDAFEAACVARGLGVRQIFCNLGEPWVGQAVAFLRGRGYFLGGMLPCWFGHDGLLLQRLDQAPATETIRLHGPRGRMLLDMLLRDREAVVRGEG